MVKYLLNNIRKNLICITYILKRIFCTFIMAFRTAFCMEYVKFIALIEL